MTTHAGACLVTGGAGFIGSTLVDRLLDLGRRVIVVDDFSRGSRENLRAAEAWNGLSVRVLDIRDAALRTAMVEAAPMVVYHLAAQIDVRASLTDPVHDADVNILGTLNVLEAARRAGVKKVIVASSGGSIYGEDIDVPVPEDSPGRPVSPYAIGKRVLQDYLEFYARTYGLAWTICAPANVYGPRQRADGEAGVVAVFLRAMLTSRPTRIYGTGHQTRDFVFVGDVVDAFVRAAEGGTGVYNIGTGIETSVGRLWEMCAEATSYVGKPEMMPRRPGELERSALDPGRARRELGWSPHTDLRTGLQLTLDHLRAVRSTGVGDVV